MRPQSEGPRKVISRSKDYMGLLYCKYAVLWSKKGVTKRCRLSWLTNSALVYEPKCGGRGGVAGSQPMSTAVHRSPNKLWRSSSIFNLWLWCRKLATLEADANRGNERADGAEKKIRWRTFLTERHPRFFISYFLHIDKKKSLSTNMKEIIKRVPVVDN
jgi:hypothetical protein